MSLLDLAAVGDVLLDVVAPTPAELPRHGPIQVTAGGSAVNAARAVTRAGRSALVVGSVGDDAVGRLVRDDLIAAGIDARLAVVAGERTGRAVYAGDAVLAERGANAAFSPDDVPPEVHAAAVLVSGYQLLREDSGPGAEAGFALGGVVGVDLGAAPLVERYGAGRARELLRRADVVFGGADAVAALGDLVGPLVVTTLGADGARAGGVHVRPARVVAGPLVGAGDALAATMLLVLAGGASVEEALELGCAAGAGVALASSER
jgi:ribokinase